MEVSLKKLKKIASERNKEGRNAFISHMAMYEPEELGFLDETSKNEKMAARTRGRARKGHRAVMRQCFVRGHWLSATGSVLTIDGIVLWYCSYHDIQCMTLESVSSTSLEIETVQSRRCDPGLSLSRLPAPWIVSLHTAFLLFRFHTIADRAVSVSP